MTILVLCGFAFCVLGAPLCASPWIARMNRRYDEKAAWLMFGMQIVRYGRRWALLIDRPWRRPERTWATASLHFRHVEPLRKRNQAHDLLA